jgi:hypothetical protein
MHLTLYYSINFFFKVRREEKEKKKTKKGKINNRPFGLMTTIDEYGLNNIVHYIMFSYFLQLIIVGWLKK